MKRSTQVGYRHESIRTALAEAAKAVYSEEASFTEVAEAIEVLHGELATHFLDESKGVLSEIEQQAPHLLNRVQDLRQEHESLLGMAGELATMAVAAGERGELREEFGILRNWVRDHERRENELLFSAFDDDIGYAD